MLLTIGFRKHLGWFREKDPPSAAKFVSVRSTFQIKRFATLHQFVPLSEVQVGIGYLLPCPHLRLDSGPSLTFSLSDATGVSPFSRRLPAACAAIALTRLPRMKALRAAL